MSSFYGAMNHCVAALEGTETMGEKLVVLNWVNVSVFKEGRVHYLKNDLCTFEKRSKVGDECHSHRAKGI